MLRAVKEEIFWLNEFSSLKEAKHRIGQWIEVDYNKLRVHSELGYIVPEEFKELYRNQILIKEAV